MQNIIHIYLDEKRRAHFDAVTAEELLQIVAEEPHLQQPLARLLLNTGVVPTQVGARLSGEFETPFGE